MALRNLPAHRRGFSAPLLRDFNRLFPAELGNLFGEEFSNLAEWEPAIDVKEDDKEYLITADVPGVSPEDVDIRLENKVLTLSGERKSESRDEKNGYRRVERFEGSFYRAVSLPDAGDAESVKAKAKHGVISIHVPKSKERHSKKITVSG